MNHFMFSFTNHFSFFTLTRNMMKSFFAILLILSATLAYVPVVPSVVRVSSSSLKMGYVPDGLTAEEYEMIKAQKEKAVAERKQKFKNKTYEVR
mmetsp:Transcript_399/g.571  ORF Transcript_399/g.571 Transcript_399/m.571 type:complete len:94 (-) Transcript_399:231-512(-)